MMRHIGLCPRPVIGGPQLAPDGLEPALYGAKVADRLARLPRIVQADVGDQFHDPAALYGDAPVDERLRHAPARILDDVERHPRLVESQRQRRKDRPRAPHQELTAARIIDAELRAEEPRLTPDHNA